MASHRLYVGYRDLHAVIQPFIKMVLTLKDHSFCTWRLYSGLGCVCDGRCFPVVLIGRLIQGIGTGLILPLMFSVAMQIFPPYKLGTVMGMAALVIMFAPAIGPTITGLVLAKFTWHYIFGYSCHSWFWLSFSH